MTESFNPSRLILARKRQGWTKAQLAAKAGLSTRILFAYERVEKEPSSDTLAILADLLRFPTEFFFGPDLDEPSLEGASFRSLKKLTARHRDQALASGALALALADWISARFHLPIPTIPLYDGVEPETAAQAVRSEWGLGERPIKNMIHLLEAHGVQVFSLREECHDVDAFSLWRDSVPYVFLNTIKSPEHTRMDGAHELGHLVLHRRVVAHGRDLEREARAFASALLMPAGSVIATAPRRGTMPQLIQAKRNWNVSLSALAYRMHTVGLLSDWQYRALFIEMNSNGYLKEEPQSCQAETSEVLAKVFRSLRADGVTMADVAHDLRVYPDELNRLVFGLVLTEIRGLSGSKA